MDPDQEDLQQPSRRERLNSNPELPSVDLSAATKHSTDSSWVMRPQLPDSGNSSTEQSECDAEESRAPLKRGTSPGNLYVRKQSDLDPMSYSKGQQQAHDKKPATKSKSRYDSDPWGNWDANTQSRPVYHRGYQQEYPQPALGDRNPFAPSVPTPYISDSRYLSPNYDYRPYVVDRLNPLVRNPPSYAQPWTQPISTVSIPYSLLGPRSGTGVKDFSSYSFAPSPLPSDQNNRQGHHSITGSSHSLPDRLDSKGSDDSDDDHRGVILPSNSLHAGSSSQSKKSRVRPVNRPADVSVTKGLLDPQLKSVPAVSSTLSGAEAVPLPPSRSQSALEFDSTLKKDVLPLLPPLPASGRSSPGQPGAVQQPLSQEWPYTTEHTKSTLEHPHTANGVAPDNDNILMEDVFEGMSLSDFPDFFGGVQAAEAKAAKKAKSTRGKGKAAKRNPIVVDVPPPPMPPPPNFGYPPFFQPGHEPTIIDVDASPRLKKSRQRRKRSSHLPGSTSSFAKRVRSLIPCMPHLEALYSFDRDPKTSPVITRLDYKNSIENPRRKSRRVLRSRDWLGLNSGNFAKKLSSGGTSSPFLRVLFVEDLTEALIDSLGTLYGVDPELFASHMSSSGSSSLSYDDPPPTRWSTAKMRKSYYSLKWYRPVRLEKRVSQWLRSPKDLAKLGDEGIEWSETTHERRGQDIHETKTHHSVTLNNNIFRRSWPLSSDPDGAPDGGLHAAWEEKASVFITSKEGSRVSTYLRSSAVFGLNRRELIMQ